ncbi:hypothetical protein CRUP_025317 [Coryphaenoides rupestris]|nr:hypothetical protein CRUP_025317 [Coryphaenoides rupestris]
MAGLLKKTTGLVGLAVSKTPRDRLKLLYSKILATLQTLPQDAAYRRCWAECELALSRKMAVWKPWEPLVEEPPPNQWKWPI